MPVLISARTPRASRQLIRQLRVLATNMLTCLQCADRELSVLLCDDREIRTLNSRYRGQPKATDVLAFGAEPEPRARRAAAQPVPLLGDVVISLQTAERQAHQHSASMLQETSFLLAHGLLHLLGMDHDTPRKAGAMNRRTARLLQAVGLTPPLGAEALAAAAPVAANRRNLRPKVRSQRPRTAAGSARNARMPR
jgi:probable rRNA maturation factor